MDLTHKIKIYTIYVVVFTHYTLLLVQILIFTFDIYEPDSLDLNFLQTILYAMVKLLRQQRIHMVVHYNINFCGVIIQTI